MCFHIVLRRRRIILDKELFVVRDFRLLTNLGYSLIVYVSFYILY
jgi:hypothetical protein